MSPSAVSGPSMRLVIVSRTVTRLNNCYALTSLTCRLPSTLASLAWVLANTLGSLACVLTSTLASLPCVLANTQASKASAS